ncbi:MAG: type II toxin-antitoxin system HicB family antitoxin [Planctomycetes bacterium]|nr:type II toxin-antitoxin system HicB family antitoxin [Planctomycetota bacterium]
MPTLYRIPLLLTPQPEGGYTVTSPALPELITEGDTAEEAVNNVRDALDAALELYADEGRPLPQGVLEHTPTEPIRFEYLVSE